MMTFLVVADFIENARLLDPARCWKQVIEASELINTIQNGAGWKNHPIAKSWAVYLGALKYYYNCVLAEYIRRGGFTTFQPYPIPTMILTPWWVSWNRLHQSHRAMLFRKDPFYYQDKFTIEPEYMSYGYIWANTVPYEQRTAPLALITAPIPPELVNPTYCRAILKSGARAGTPCNHVIKPPNEGMKKAEKEHFLAVTRYTHPYCGIHRKKYATVN